MAMGLFSQLKRGMFGCIARGDLDWVGKIYVCSVLGQGIKWFSQSAEAEMSESRITKICDRQGKGEENTLWKV